MRRKGTIKSEKWKVKSEKLFILLYFFLFDGLFCAEKVFNYSFYC